MVKIKKIKVERFRSINVLDVVIEQDSNLIAICGKNNVGKTNFLRAINLFFNPDIYDISVDMTKLKVAQGGSTKHPKITITFEDEDLNKEYIIIRDFNKKDDAELGLSGFYKDMSSRNKKQKMELKKIRELLASFEFIYIESINVILPRLINDISDEVIDAKYYKSRFISTKKQLKESYDNYIDGLKEILDSFAKDISETFKEFQPEWSVRFDVPKNSDSFRGLISEDVSLTLDDSGSVGIEDKGAGLQRLAAILLQFELLTRKTNKKNNIVCIDEPDVYIHEGLQRKLRDFLLEKTSDTQIFLTTHSKVFLNEYTMKNVFLFDANHRKQYSARKKRNINVVETYVVDIEKEDGYKKICDHLGIEIKTYEPLQKRNLLVEGGCDKKYLSQMARYFGFEVPNIITADGADNIIKYLQFYDSYYSDSDKVPEVKVVLDNDAKGRNVFNSMKVSSYKNIKVTKVMMKNYNGEDCGKNGNFEIEDLMYPEVIISLVNSILIKKKMNEIDEDEVLKKIQAPAYKSGGILNLLENEKNASNLETGNQITFVGEECTFKKSMGGMFDIEGNKKMISLIGKCEKKYPQMKEVIREIISF